MWDAFYRVVKRIPRGRVSTYGAIAIAAGFPRHSRHVGYSLAGLSRRRSDVPWQRVLGKAGARHAKVTIADPFAASRQRALLEREGVAFDARGRVLLDAFGAVIRPSSASRSPTGSSRAARARAGRAPRG